MAFAARAAMILLVLGFAGAIAEGVHRAIREAAQQKQWLESNAKWQFRLLRNDTELNMTGGIGVGFAQDLERMLREHQRIAVVHTNLELGGLVAEAEQAATSVQIRALTTYVSTSCVSACTLIYLAGIQRVLRHGARLGFHTVSAPGLTGVALQNAERLQTEYLEARGVAIEFADRAAHTVKEAMWFPHERELTEAHVVHRIEDGDDFAFTAAERIAPAQIESDLLKERIYRVLKAKHPATFTQILAAIGDGTREGRSKREIEAETRRILGTYFRAQLLLADDKAVVRFGRVIVQEFATLAEAGSAACNNYLGNGDARASSTGSSYFSEDVQHEELDAMADVLDSADANRASDEESKAATQRLAQAQVRVRQRLARTLLQAAALPVRAPRCEDGRRYLSAVLALPPADAALVLRHFMAKSR